MFFTIDESFNSPASSEIVEDFFKPRFFLSENYHLLKMISWANTVLETWANLHWTEQNPLHDQWKFRLATVITDFGIVFEQRFMIKACSLVETCTYEAIAHLTLNLDLKFENKKNRSSIWNKPLLSGLQTSLFELKHTVHRKVILKSTSLRYRTLTHQWATLYMFKCV